MRKFEQCTFANLHARWKTINDGSFSGADQARRALVVVIRLEIETQDNTLASLACYAPFHIDKSILRLKDSLFHIFAHAGLNVPDAFLPTWFFEIDFRKG